MIRHLLLACTLTTVAFASAHAQPADATAGATAFKQRCSVCHSTETTPKGVMGPGLRGIVGRKAATQPKFDYSAGLADSGLTWTPANLDNFLKAPTKTAPGTRMVMAVPSPKDRANIIAYLATLK